jgi:hypothetical protein
MGKASSSKKVARAARTAGKPGQSKNWVWPVVMSGVVLLGLGLVVLSVLGRDQAEAGPPEPGDHWHAAYGINVCGEWLPPLQDIRSDQTGIHTHADGLIHMHPFSSRFGGANANLATFGGETGLELAEGEMTLPDGTTYADGDECDGEEGELTLTVWDSADAEEARTVEGDPADYAPQDGEVVVLSFQPAGAEIPKPPTVARLADPLAAEEGRTPVPLDDVPDVPEDAITDGTEPEDDASPDDGEGGLVEDTDSADEAEEGDADS